MTHSIIELGQIGSGNGLLPIWHQAITYAMLAYCHFDIEEQIL